MSSVVNKDRSAPAEPLSGYRNYHWRTSVRMLPGNYSSPKAWHYGWALSIRLCHSLRMYWFSIRFSVWRYPSAWTAVKTTIPSHTHIRNRRKGKKMRRWIPAYRSRLYSDGISDYSLYLHPVHRDWISELWGDDSFFNSRSLHVFITKLRHKLSQDEQIRIVNVRGIGYKLIAN